MWDPFQWKDVITWWNMERSDAAILILITLINYFFVLVYCQPYFPSVPIMKVKVLYFFIFSS